MIKEINEKYLKYFLKENKTCHCGHTHDLKDEVETWLCNLKCKNSEYRCGGLEAYSVYIGKRTNQFLYYIHLFGLIDLILSKTFLDERLN